MGKHTVNLVLDTRDAHCSHIRFFVVSFWQVFLRETEKLLLDDMLHQHIMKRIVFMQRWMKMRLQREHFRRMRMASVVIQVRKQGQGIAAAQERYRPAPP